MQETDRLNTLKVRIKQIESQIDEKSKILSTLRASSAKNQAEPGKKFVRVANPQVKQLKNQPLPSLKPISQSTKPERAISEDRGNMEKKDNSADLVLKLKAEIVTLTNKLENQEKLLKAKEEESKRSKEENEKMLLDYQNTIGKLKSENEKLVQSLKEKEEENEANLKQIADLKNSLPALSEEKAKEEPFQIVEERVSFQNPEALHEVQDTQNEGSQQNQLQGEPEEKPEEEEITQGQGDRGQNLVKEKEIPVLVVFQDQTSFDSHFEKVKDIVEVFFNTQMEEASEVLEGVAFTIGEENRFSNKVGNVFLVGTNLLPEDKDSVQNFLTTLETVGFERRIKQIVFLTGPPGCGKGTVCKNLMSEFQLQAISVGESLRSVEGELKSTLQELMSQGKLIDSKLVVKVLVEALKKVKPNKKNSIVVDGFPRNLENLSSWLTAGMFAEHLIFFEVAKEEAKRRILGRGEGRVDDNEDAFELRWKTFEGETLAAVEEFALSHSIVKVNAEQEIADVVSEFKSKVLFLEKISKKKVLVCFGGEMSGFFASFLCEHDKRYVIVHCEESTTIEESITNILSKSGNIVVTNFSKFSETQNLISSLPECEFTAILFSDVSEGDVKEPIEFFEKRLQINTEENMSNIFGLLKAENLIENS